MMSVGCTRKMPLAIDSPKASWQACMNRDVVTVECSPLPKLCEMVGGAEPQQQRGSAQQSTTQREGDGAVAMTCEEESRAGLAHDAPARSIIPAAAALGSQLSSKMD